MGGGFPYSLGTLITDLTMDRAFASLIGVSQVPGRLENLPVPQLFAPGREKGAEDWQQSSRSPRLLSVYASSCPSLSLAGRKFCFVLLCTGHIVHVLPPKFPVRTVGWLVGCLYLPSNRFCFLFLGISFSEVSRFRMYVIFPLREKIKGGCTSEGAKTWAK